MSTRFGQHEQEIFEQMQEFCEDSFERDDYKLNDTFRITSKVNSKKDECIVGKQSKQTSKGMGKHLIPSWKTLIPIYRSPTQQRAVYIQ